MDNLLTVALEAHNTEKNHHRRYSIRVGRGLLNDWTVTIGHGRTGQAGQETHFASPRAEEAQDIVHERLRRRISAPTRIGCAYKLVNLNTVNGFNITAWLPRDLLVALS